MRVRLIRVGCRLSPWLVRFARAPPGDSSGGWTVLLRSLRGSLVLDWRLLRRPLLCRWLLNRWLLGCSWWFRLLLTRLSLRRAGRCR